MLIRPATLEDADAIWIIFHSVVEAGDTYVFSPDISREDALGYWFAEGTRTYVAEQHGAILGTYIIRANQPDLGSHIANASYMVAEGARGKGIGSRMCAHSLTEATQLGFLAMQFNIVVSTNEAAIHLWQKHGFRILGTIPQGYRHQQLGLVDAHIMYRSLES